MDDIKLKFFILTMITILSLVIISGTSYALFSDSAYNNGNIFKAGTLSIFVNSTGGYPVDPVFYVDENLGEYSTGVWAPGDIHTGVLQIENKGSLDAKIISLSASLREGSDPDLAEKFKVYVSTIPNDPPDPIDTDYLIASGTLADFANGKTFEPIPLPVGDNPIETLYFRIEFSKDVDNSYQNQNLVVDFNVNATQARNNY